MRRCGTLRLYCGVCSPTYVLHHGSKHADSSRQAATAPTRILCLHPRMQTNENHGFANHKNAKKRSKKKKKLPPPRIEPATLTGWAERARPLSQRTNDSTPRYSRCTRWRPILGVVRRCLLASLQNSWLVNSHFLNSACAARFREAPATAYRHQLCSSAKALAKISVPGCDCDFALKG